MPAENCEAVQLVKGEKAYWRNNKRA